MKSVLFSLVALVGLGFAPAAKACDYVNSFAVQSYAVVNPVVTTFAVQTFVPAVAVQQVVQKVAVQQVVQKQVVQQVKVQKVQQNVRSVSRVNIRSRLRVH